MADRTKVSFMTVQVSPERQPVTEVLGVIAVNMPDGTHRGMELAVDRPGGVFIVSVLDENTEVEARYILTLAHEVPENG